MIDLKNRRKNKQQTFSVSCDVAQNVAELKNIDNISNVNCRQNPLSLATPNFSRSVSLPERIVPSCRGLALGSPSLIPNDGHDDHDHDHDAYVDD